MLYAVLYYTIPDKMEMLWQSPDEIFYLSDLAAVRPSIAGSGAGSFAPPWQPRS